MYINDMTEIDNNRSKEFNISRSVDPRVPDDGGSTVYRKSEKEILL